MGTGVDSDFESPESPSFPRFITTLATTDVRADGTQFSKEVLEKMAVDFMTRQLIDGPQIVRVWVEQTDTCFSLKGEFEVRP